ncbi:hypothetical protein [Methanobacterium sp.]|uniref:hypothetical protein n=1 Tax=Methanobacterium sp. TaxID=2164 RepID=UPI002ABC7F8C|nr:hypothetical protein [Methanobacterium sp.]MDY9922927.1 hypothetical protein [Methanobacterium sp.]
MFHYKAFGLEISSEIELPGMIQSTGNEHMEGSGYSDVKITLGKVDPSQVTLAEVEGPNYLVTGCDVYLWWDDIGKVRISDGKEVTVEPVADLDGSDELNLIPFLLGPVMALMLHQRGFLVLHGSAVNMGHGAVAFLGHRGNGKSTTAIHLYVEGYPLMADDILAIKFDNKGSSVVYPGYPHVRLSEEAYNQVKGHTDILTPIRTLAEKVFCDASHRFSTEPVNLERIYVIEKVSGDDQDNNPEIRDENKTGKMDKGILVEDGTSNKTGSRISVLKSQENLIDLIRHSVANRIFQQTTQKENLILCAQLLNNVTVKKLVLVHSFDNIQEMVRVVEEDVGITP